jgi:hypothetical protein
VRSASFLVSGLLSPRARTARVWRGREFAPNAADSLGEEPGAKHAQTALFRGRQLAGDFPNEAMRRQSLLLWGVVSVYCSLQNQFSKAQLHGLFAFVTAEPAHQRGLGSSARALTPAREREMSLCERQTEPLTPHRLPLIQTETCEGLRRSADHAPVRVRAAVNLKREV